MKLVNSEDLLSSFSPNDSIASVLAKEVDRRKNFAIISHPDAGKTTLTEKLSSALNAKLLSCPPRLEAPDLHHGDLRVPFDNTSPSIRRAYYKATNLVASQLAIESLKHGHVVMDRYWTMERI